MVAYPKISWWLRNKYKRNRACANAVADRLRMRLLLDCACVAIFDMCFDVMAVRQKKMPTVVIMTMNDVMNPSGGSFGRFSQNILVAEK